PSQMQANFAGPGPGTGDPVTTSFVYIGPAFGDPGYQFVVALNVTPRDLLGNARSDVLIYDPSLGQEYSGLSSGNGTYQFIPNLFTSGFDILRSGDFNGDGKVD